MLSIRSALFALCCVFAVGSATVVAPVAEAQGTKIIVINQAKIYADSRSGKDIETKIDNIERSMQAELKPAADSLKTQGDALRPRLEGKTQAQLAADAALIQELQAFEQQVAQHQRNQQIKAAELQATIRKARADWAQALEPVLQEVMTEQNAEIMMSRNDLVFAASNVDVTAVVTSKLDARTPSIAVVRQRLPQQPAAQ
ncbi:OmpH family outer membrane protein [Hyphomonas sp. FCG-A18]|jgi:outer membrane protein|uniref:OmpH family outer membrane protein n=1 Tax=Hyphomonas sp. FCG-A18 TaxID=3080019 RepID=UPI002B293D90|nr:OmpH family outer membrane protein [Hyphomonas sp. FCG-A18]